MLTEIFDPKHTFQLKNILFTSIEVKSLTTKIFINRTLDFFKAKCSAY